MKRIFFTLAATLLASPAGAMDYLHCEAMQRRLNVELLGRGDRASAARQDYLDRTAPTPRQVAQVDDDCLNDGNTKIECAVRLISGGTVDPRSKEANRIYFETYQAETPVMRRIKADMTAAGCF